MGKFEKIYVIFSLLYMAGYSLFFLNAMSSSMTNPENFQNILPYHFFGMALSLGFIIVIVRDIVKRKFKNPNSKVLWSLLVVFFWPSVFIYLPKYAFKSRDEIQESGNNLKYIIASITISCIYFGYIGYSMYSILQNVEKNFAKNENSLAALASSGHDEKILLLLKSDINKSINIDGDGNLSPLLRAVINNHPSTVRLLLEHGASVNKKSKCNGNTPLHIAAKNGYYDVTKVLLESGADKTILNDKNKTPYNLAVEGGYLSIAEYIENHP